MAKKEPKVNLDDVSTHLLQNEDGIYGIKIHADNDKGKNAVKQIIDMIGCCEEKEDASE